MAWDNEAVSYHFVLPDTGPYDSYESLCELVDEINERMDSGRGTFRPSDDLQAVVYETGIDSDEITLKALCDLYKDSLRQLHKYELDFVSTPKWKILARKIHDDLPA